MTAVLDAALGYAARGLAVFPVDPATKRPRTTHGYLDATTDPELVDRAFRPGGSAIGVATGHVVVVDVDVPAGIVSMEELCSRLGGLGRTATATTPSGGRHHWLRCPTGVELPCSAGKLAPGVDIRAHGGYVVAPPAPGRKWMTRAPLVEVPDDWAREIVSTRPPGGGHAAGPRATDDEPLRTIPAREYVAALTGREPDRRGYICCPLHKGGEERTPSFLAGGRDELSWRCFGCDTGGGLFELAALLAGYALPLRGAAFLAVRDRLRGLFPDRRAVAA